MGYTNIAIYNGGLRTWQLSNEVTTVRALPVLEEFAFIKNTRLREMLEVGEPVTIVDLRVTASERAKGRLPGANYQILALDDLLSEEVRDRLPRTGTIVTVTETGNRDKIVQRFLSQYGFTNVVGLKNGFRGWVKAGLPLEEPAS
jgi:rhodanese-related sulfurtransferase